MIIAVTLYVCSERDWRVIAIKIGKKIKGIRAKEIAKRERILTKVSHFKFRDKIFK